MKCTICGQATLPGGMLCRPCKAALKRARYLSVQELPRASIWRRKPSQRSARARAKIDESHPIAAQIPLRDHPAFIRSLAVVALLGAVGVIAYLGQQRTAEGDPVVESGHRWVPLTDVTARESPAATTPPATAVVPGAGNRSTNIAPIPSNPPPRVRADAGTGSAKGTLPARRQAAAQVLAAPSMATTPGTPSDGYDVPAEPPKPAPPPPAPVPAPPPPPDRWQAMSDALAQCAREGGFGGVICDQRVRLQGCAGYWGRVPQCANPPEYPQK